MIWFIFHFFLAKIEMLSSWNILTEVLLVCVCWISLVRWHIFVTVNGSVWNFCAHLFSVFLLSETSDSFLTMKLTSSMEYIIPIGLMLENIVSHGRSMKNILLPQRSEYSTIYIICSVNSFFLFIVSSWPHSTSLDVPQIQYIYTIL